MEKYKIRFKASATKAKLNNLYRIRQGLYRIVYEIRDNELVVHVIKVGHHSDVYNRT